MGDLEVCSLTFEFFSWLEGFGHELRPEAKETTSSLQQ